MRIVDVSHPGGPEVMRIATAPRPEPDDDEVLIKVAVAGVNRPDVIQRMGLYPAPGGASPILGLEVSGVIVDVGAEVEQWKPGDRVCALTNGGGYADYVAVTATQCLPVPSGLTLSEAAALPETCFTVWSNVFMRAGLKTDETLLVHGGASGIGTIAIQMAVARGARVFTTVGSEEKVRACRTLGAEVALNYHNDPDWGLITEATAGRGIDVILDMVGGDYVEKNIRLAATDGRIVNIAYLNGAKVDINLLPVMLKRLTLTGSTLRPQSKAVKQQIADELREYIWPLINTGKIKPVLAKSFDLTDVVNAHLYMESRVHIGKIVLQVSDLS